MKVNREADRPAARRPESTLQADKERFQVLAELKLAENSTVILILNVHLKRAC